MLSTFWAAAILKPLPVCLTTDIAKRIPALSQERGFILSGFEAYQHAALFGIETAQGVGLLNNDAGLGEFLQDRILQALGRRQIIAVMDPHPATLVTHGQQLLEQFTRDF